jgi:tetratricopeptide (TPR) repeat protein
MNLIDQLTKLHNEEPNDPFNYYALALEVQKTQQGKALEMFRDLLHKYPEYLATYYTAGQLMAELGLNQDALKVYEKGIEQAQLQKNDKTLHELKGAHTMLQIEEGMF